MTFYKHMRAAGYTDVERGERGSTEEHLTVTQFKVQAEQQRLEEVLDKLEQDTPQKAKRSAGKKSTQPLTNKAA